MESDAKCDQRGSLLMRCAVFSGRGVPGISGRITPFVFLMNFIRSCFDRLGRLFILSSCQCSVMVLKRCLACGLSGIAGRCCRLFAVSQSGSFWGWF